MRQDQRGAAGYSLQARRADCRWGAASLASSCNALAAALLTACAHTHDLPLGTSSLLSALLLQFKWLIFKVDSSGKRVSAVRSCAASAWQSVTMCIVGLPRV
jgi:hypothetical protein